MTSPFDFADRLQHYVNKTAYTSGQLASLSGLPRTTIVNWLNGRVSRPRDWQPIVQLLAVLHLEEREADEVLQSAGQPTINELRLIARSEADRALLAVWERPKAPSTPTYRPPFQAVADIPYFVGREAVMDELQSHLLDAESSGICVLQGMAGTGKTAAATRIAYQLRPHFPDGVLWARLDLSDTMMILHTFAQAYGAEVSHYDDIASRSRVVRDLLADKRALIILDNAMDSAGVEPLLPPTGQCAVLITTRRHDLRVAQGANRLTLQPFQADSQSSQQLFAHFLGRERAEADAAPLAEIAELIGHLPLALAIVAGRLAYEPGWSTAEFLARMQTGARRLKELQSEDQNVRLSFAASYELLPEEVQPLFTCLCRFGGEDFSPAAAGAAAGIPLEDAQDYLRTLYRLSLVQSGRAGRYRLHPLLRDYAREKLPDGTPWTLLAVYFTDFIKAHPPGDPALDLEGDNISAVITGAQSNGETAASLDLLIAFTPYLKMQGLYTAAQERLTAALALANDDQHLSILLHLSQIARYFRRYGEAEGYLETAVSLAKPESADMGAILNEKGIIAGCRADYAGAREHFKRGLALAREDGAPNLLIPLLKESGAAEVAFGNYDTAESLYQEALAQAQQEAPLYVPALLRCLAGIAIIRDRDFDRAGELYQEGLQQARTMNSREDVIFLLNNLAVVAFEQGHYAQAKALLAEGLALARTLLHQAGEAMIAGNMGRLAAHEGQWDKAREYLEVGLGVAEAVKHLELIASLRRSLDTLAEIQSSNDGEQKRPDIHPPAFPERLKIFYD